MPDWLFPEPPYAHLPGINPRHDPSLFDAVKAATPDRTISAEASENRAWRHGLDLLAAGYYWEAHEVLEPVWLAAAPNSAERRMVQAVIQLANAALKARQGQARAADRIAALVRNLLQGLSQSVMGVLPGDVDACLEQIAAHSTDGVILSVGNLTG